MARRDVRRLLDDFMKRGHSLNIIILTKYLTINEERRMQKQNEKLIFLIFHHGSLQKSDLRVV